MRTRKKTEITIETESVVVVSRGKVSVSSWCHQCGARTKMITVDQAATLAQVTSRMIYRWAEGSKLHFTETSAGHLLICAESIQITTLLDKEHARQ